MRHYLKHAALNWTFSREDYDAFVADVWPIVDATPGYLDCLEAFFLYQTAKSLKPQRSVDQPLADRVVEIGSYKGRSTLALGLGLKQNPHEKWHLVCVDHFFNNQLEALLQETFLKNVQKAQLQDIVTCLPYTSREAMTHWSTDRGIAMLWIDGNHDEDYVREDFHLWKRLLIPGGIVVFHDFYLLGVRRVLLQDLFSNPSFQDLCVINDNLVAASKVNSLPTREQKALKQRVYWALRTGSLNPWRACMHLAFDAINHPFGHIEKFFTQELSLQRE